MLTLQTELLEKLNNRFPAQNIGDANSIDLHFYHAPNSICSQKVRAVLAYHQMPHVSHLLDIFKGETYDPAYVRVRHTGCKQAGLTLSSRHMGTTSVITAGCDACVVPTVVEARSGNVIVDSLRICLTLDEMVPEAGRLVPPDLKQAVSSELAIVDDLPNYQNLAVQVIKSGAPRNAFAVSKVKRCEELLAVHGDDPDLRAAYEAKRDKEHSAANELFDEGALNDAQKWVEDALRDLEERLARTGGNWLLGNRITMADLFWGAEMIRVEDLGGAHIWENGSLPKLEAWFHRVCGLPAIRSAIIEFPGARLPRRQAQS